ncbi:hypothetical protein CVT24_006683 [Panaeolus cyanescens]|uniref:DUF6535 domain-containing protein n=1 Tax=Panaeolus cyanescens TaxID=181874 RepID=A0A409YRW8_9AGAR|nr:hypothetical protein CVT24_006683 [Panaeolus cyanescens]
MHHFPLAGAISDALNWWVQVWEKAAQIATEFDDNMCEAWMEEIQNLLVFSGLFSAVVTAFAVEAQKLLQPDAGTATVILLTQISAKINNNTTTFVAPDIIPNISPATSKRINALIFTSLILSLGTAFIGIIVLQWIRSFRKYEPMPHQRHLCVRSLRYQGLIFWKIPEIVSFLPIVIQLALIFFFIGLLYFLGSLAPELYLILISGWHNRGDSSFCSVHHSSTNWRQYNFSGLLRQYPSIPAYQSPQSWLFFRLLSAFFPSLNSVQSWTQAQAEITNKVTFANRNHDALPEVDDLHLEGKGDILPKSLLWLFRNTHEMDPFAILFHCFIALQTTQKKVLLDLLFTQEDYDALGGHFDDSSDSTNYLTMLISWADGQAAIELPSSVHLYIMELGARAMQEPSQQQLIPSRSQKWCQNMLDNDYTNTPLGGSESSLNSVPERLIIFAFLVSLHTADEYVFNPLRRPSHKFFVCLLTLELDHGDPQSVNTVDDALRSVGGWLWNRTGIDGCGPDADPLALQSTSTIAGHIIYDMLAALTESTRSVDAGIRIFKRGSCEGILSYLANDPYGRQVWGSSIPTRLLHHDIDHNPWNGGTPPPPQQTIAEGFLNSSFMEFYNLHVLSVSQPSLLIFL